MTQWVKGAILALFLASYPFTYFLGSNNKDKEWAEKYALEVERYESAVAKLVTKILLKDAAFNREITLITENSEKVKKQYENKLADLERSTANSLQQSSKRADVYRSQARASEAERENLATHCSRLDQALVEGKAVAGELRITLEQREAELRELGTVLKSIEKKYE